MRLNESTPKESLPKEKSSTPYSSSRAKLTTKQGRAGRDPTGQVIKKLIRSRPKTPADLALFKRKIAKKYKISCPSNIQLLKAYHTLVRKKRIKKVEKIENLLRTRPIRSLSGIVNVSVLTKPYPCPGECLYCPLEEGIPKSYLSGEPAVERAKALNYDPYLQTQRRIEMLTTEGHPTDKIDLRIIGGTWSFYPKRYQTWFITRCFAACNAELRRTKPRRRTFNSLRGRRRITRKIKSLKEEQKLNEKSKHRLIGISVETRPDFIDEKEIKRMRKLGITRVEMGIQSIYDDVLKLNRRGHGVKEIILATKLLKDAGLKVCYQMMPNLPGSNPKRDEKMFKELFSNPNFQPDYLKIYPTALLKEAPLYHWWKKGKYKPYTEKKLINLIKAIKKKIPYYVRIQRITRDIPSQFIVAGPTKISNLRQIIAKDMKTEGWKCKCIRCREIREKYSPREKLYSYRQDYEASDGKEVLLSFENKNRERLYSLLRLRIPSQVFEERKPRTRINSVRGRHFLRVLDGAAIIREIQTFGQLVPIGEKKIAPQHRGLGKKLIKEAEKIAYTEFSRSARKELGSRSHRYAKRCGRVKKVAVISGIGARNYWQRLNYFLKNTYMVKYLK